MIWPIRFALRDVPETPEMRAWVDECQRRVEAVMLSQYHELERRLRVVCGLDADDVDGGAALAREGLTLEQWQQIREVFQDEQNALWAAQWQGSWDVGAPDGDRTVVTVHRREGESIPAPHAWYGHGDDALIPDTPVEEWNAKVDALLEECRQANE